MSKKVVVFGGCGFIGSYVVQELIQNGYDVVAADLNTSEYIDHKYFKKIDILDQGAVLSVVGGTDIVYNFAGFANLDDAIANPIRAIELNVMGNLNILEACRVHHVKRFIYASSAYAMSDKGSFYGISKLTSEKLTEEYYKKFGLEFTIVRYGSVYGKESIIITIFTILSKALCLQVKLNIAVMVRKLENIYMLPMWQSYH